MVITGLALVMVMEGRCEEGIKYVESESKGFANDGLYAYNTACVYGRALEFLNKSENIKDREKKQAAYKQKALSELRRSVKMGFSDLKWMRKDPDLKLLQNDTEFKKIHSPSGRKQ